MLRILCVLYNSQKHIAPLLDSLQEFIQVPAEIVFWDNAKDQIYVEQYIESQKTYPFPIHVFGKGTNLGFASGVNLASQKKTSPESPEAYLIINPDSILMSPLNEDNYKKLLGEEAVIGLRVFNDIQKKQRQSSARSFPNFLTAIAGRQGLLTKLWPKNSFSRRYLGAEIDPNKKTLVDWVSGSAMFVQNKIWNKLKGFDERFFMFVEDVDLGRRAKEMKIPVIYYPLVDVFHEIGGSASQISTKSDLYHHRAMLEYHKKWTTGIPRLFIPIVALFIYFRFLFRRFFKS